MKVVIFCGGLGVRMGEETQRIPKPMITVGGRPILWHIMKWYASWGYDDFVLCLGYKGEVHQGLLPELQRGAVQRLRPLERRPGRRAARQATSRLAHHLRRHRRAVDDRRAAARGRASPRGRRILPRDVRRRADGRAAARHDRAAPQSSGKTGLFISVRPMFNAHVVHADADGVVRAIEDMQHADVWINGGFMVLRRDILDHINPGEELVVEPFAPPDREGRAASPTGTRDSGSRWTRSRTSSGSTRSPRAGKAPWRRAGVDATLTR